MWSSGVITEDRAIDLDAWGKAWSEGNPVGWCGCEGALYVTPTREGMIDLPFEIVGRLTYVTATCNRCSHEVVAIAGRPLPMSPEAKRQEKVKAALERWHVDPRRPGERDSA
jgi:hypothetical protein